MFSPISQVRLKEMLRFAKLLLSFAKVSLCIQSIPDVKTLVRQDMEVTVTPSNSSIDPDLRQVS